MKSFNMLALVVILGLGACSTKNSSFLDQVKGKGIYCDKEMTAPNKVAQFSANGRIIESSYSAGGTVDATFVSAIK